MIARTKWPSVKAMQAANPKRRARAILPDLERGVVVLGLDSGIMVFGDFRDYTPPQKARNFKLTHYLTPWTME